MIATAYDIPYEVKIGTLLKANIQGDILVSLKPKLQFDEDAVGDFSALFTAFDMLAQLGALGGDQIAPWNSGIETVQVSRTSNLDWYLTGCQFEERALVILAQAFLISSFNNQIQSLEIGQPPFVPLIRQQQIADPYPLLWPRSGLPLNLPQALSDSVRILIESSNALTEDQADILANRLFNCATAISMGLYGIAPIDPKTCGLLFSEKLENIGDDLVILSLEKFRAHPDAINAFLNVCMAFAKEFPIITELTVE